MWEKKVEDMATVIRGDERDFMPNPNKIDGFRLFTDTTRVQKGINPQWLNFDVRKLNPRQYNAAYHFHRYAEELFVIQQGAATLRTPKGLEEVNQGDIIFFESGETGAHQLYNHTDEHCIFLDIRTYIGHDICEYPDSDKIIIVPNGETFRRDEQHGYFEGEERIDEIWERLKNGNSLG